MDAERISSRKNKYIAHLRALASDADYRYACAEYLCDGIKLLAEALDKGARVQSVLWKDAAEELPGLDGAKQYIAPAELFDYASPMKNSPGPVFTLAMPEGHSAELRRAVSAATDLTGFGLASHALDLAPDGVSLEIDCSKIPLLPGISEMADMGLIPAGSYENKNYVGGRVTNSSEIGRFAEDIAFDPQTSGGLLIAAPQDAAEEIVRIVKNSGFPDTAIIGKFTEGRGGLTLK